MPGAPYISGPFRTHRLSYITLAPDTYGYVVMSGTWNLTDCNHAEGDYLVSLYATDPFLDETATPLMSVPILNLYEDFSTEYVEPVV